MPGKDEIQLDPDPAILIESLRDIGYSFNSALADIVDNSITAHASKVEITILHLEQLTVSIVDDGYGLTRSELLQAMRLGSSSPREQRGTDDLGRFGLGLKTASFSQCRRLTVISRKDGVTSSFTWDLDSVVAQNRWCVCETENLDEILKRIQLGPNGTAVLWQKVDRVASGGNGGRDVDRIIRESQDHLSLVFHRFLVQTAGSGGQTLQLFVNARRLKPLDPFNSSNPATQLGPEEEVSPGVRLQQFTLPHRSTYPSDEEYERYGLPGGYLKNQGVYLYRARRLIIFGTWFGLARKNALTQLSRVRIDIGTDQDEKWKIDVKKVSAQLPEEVRERLKHLIHAIGAPSKKIYRRRGTQLTSPDLLPVWGRMELADRSVYTVNREHPVIKSFISNLDAADQQQFGAVLSLIECMLPTDALFYDMANEAERVKKPSLDVETLKSVASTFFASLKQSGKDEDSILEFMRCSEPFASHWQETLQALGIREA